MLSSHRFHLDSILFPIVFIDVDAFEYFSKSTLVNLMNDFVDACKNTAIF